MPLKLLVIVVIVLADAVPNLAGIKCKYGAKMSKLQVWSNGELTREITKQPAKCVDHLHVCWGEVGQEPRCERAPPTVGNFSMEGLQPCRWYTVSVAEVVDHAATAHTTSAQFFVPAPTPTSLATTPELTLVQPNKVLLTVNDTQEDTCFSHYTVCWSSHGGEETCKKKKSYDTRLETGRLQLCANYTFRFWTSLVDEANSSVAEFVQFTGVGDVRDVRITMVNSSAIGLRWQRPPPGEGDCVHHYRVVHDSGSEDVAADTTEHIVTGLLPCKHYFVDVVAVSSRATSSNPVRRRAITRPSVPGVVRDLRVHWTSSRRVLIQWKAPEDTRYCHVRYSLCWRKSGVDNERCARHKLSPYPLYAIGKLKPCSEYTVKVAVLGAEKVLGATTAIKVMTGPEPVSDLREERSAGGGRSLHWEAPTCAQSYTVCWGTWGGGGTHSCDNTSATSYPVVERRPSRDTLAYSVVALGTSGSSSDRALVHVVF